MMRPGRASGRPDPAPKPDEVSPERGLRPDRGQRPDRGVFRIIFALPTLWLGLFFVAPLALVWALSFGEKRGLVEIEFVWTLANYLRALDPLYIGIFARSFQVAALVVLICLLIGLPVALAIAFAPGRWKPILLLLVILPFWTNLLIRTYALIAMLRTQGYVNFSLEWLADRVGVAFVPLDLLYNNAAVVAGLVYVYLPFMVLPLYAALDRMDRSLIEAAADLGAGPLQVLRTIILPLAVPGIVAGAVLVFIPALGSYLTPDLLGGADSEMIANIIARQFRRANDWPFGAALSWLLAYLAFGGLAMGALFMRGQEWRGKR